jgi:hypothetical protein
MGESAISARDAPIQMKSGAAPTRFQRTIETDTHLE